eukprot:Sspe_Gene.32688::Locus_16009_Transcript_7_10_Confidence_0.190_Length_497::g.32688::m.32688
MPYLHPMPIEREERFPSYLCWGRGEEEGRGQQGGKEEGSLYEGTGRITGDRDVQEWGGRECAWKVRGRLLWRVHEHSTWNGVPCDAVVSVMHVVIRCRLQIPLLPS